MIAVYHSESLRIDHIEDVVDNVDTYRVDDRIVVAGVTVLRGLAAVGETVIIDAAWIARPDDFASGRYRFLDSVQTAELIFRSDPKDYDDIYLETFTKPEIAQIATALGLAGVTESDTKDAMIATFIDGAARL